MCGTINSITSGISHAAGVVGDTVTKALDKPSNLPRMMGEAVAPFDPLGGAFHKFTADATTDIAKNPLASTLVTGAAGAFGGPAGAALAQGALSRERGESWGGSLKNAGLAAGLTYGAGQVFGGGSSGAENTGVSGTGFTDAGISTGGQGFTLGGGGLSGAETGLAGTGFSGTAASTGFGAGIGEGAAAGGWSLADIYKGAKTASDWLTKKPEGGGMSPAETGIGLYDMYAKSRMGEAQMQQFDRINSQIDQFYAPGSPEYNLMKQEIERKDAAAGRLSQYGPREVELAARLAPLKMNARNQALASQYGMFNQGLMNQWGAPNTLATMYGQAAKGTGTLDTVKNAVNTGQQIWDTGSKVYDWFTS
jgi:hypothetical protein